MINQKLFIFGISIHRHPVQHVHILTRRRTYEFQNQNRCFTYEGDHLYRNLPPVSDRSGSSDVFMFDPGKAKSVSTDPASVYTPGIYRSSIELNGNSFDVEVTVDAQKIRSIHLENLSESTAAMFPLVEPTLEELSSQIYSGQSLDELKYSSDQKYTSLMLIKAIDEAVSKAELKK